MLQYQNHLKSFVVNELQCIFYFYNKKAATFVAAKMDQINLYFTQTEEL